MNKKLIEDWKEQNLIELKNLNKSLDKLKKQKNNKLDNKVELIHQETFRKIDCLDCANCCSTIPPIVNKTDSIRIAKKLGMSINDFMKTYITIDEDNDMVMNQTPCPFLNKDNTCFIYEFRPKACRDYPHTNNKQFSKNFNLHRENIKHCPAVFNIVKELS